MFERILAERGVEAFNGAQGRILYVLWQGDGVPISALSRDTGLAMTTLTGMLDRMEAAGLILRERSDRGDRRKVCIRLTDAARALQADYDAVAREMGEIYYAGFSAAEIAQFEGYLARVLSNVEARLARREG